jgi:hypothetical protein
MPFIVAELKTIFLVFFVERRFIIRFAAKKCDSVCHGICCFLKCYIIIGR